jgi:DNA-binding SARP family transcriptional activator
MRALLAYLLLHGNELVSSDRLIDEVWGPEPPKTAGASLQNYISRLRKAIGPELILSKPPGYVLRVDPERFDLALFERLTAEARGASLRERADKLRAALALWRGPALEDLAFEPFIRDEVGRLEEARLTALEECIDAELALGTGDDLVGELEELVEQHPLRERFRGHLMRALYRAGRQADALAAYQEARGVLMDELGLEPSEELRSLQQAILQQDTTLGAGGEEVVERAPDRRTVTVLFCDLVDSTRLAAQLDPEVYRRLITRYFDVVREPIERHGGTVEKFIGDAVMAVFGVPELHEDDALRAVRAAIEVQEALGRLAEEAATEWDAALAGRVGVNTGEVHVLSAPGEDLHVSGAAASVASQLEERAPAGGILVSEVTYGLVRDAVRAKPVEGAWILDEVAAGAPGYARRLDAPLVGREEELQHLQTAYESARGDERCRVVTVVGEAGIGKTRLIRELVSRIGDEARVLVGRCVSYGEGATYLPIAEIVRQATPVASVVGIASLLGDAADGEQVAQRVAELTGLAEGPSAPGEAFWAVRRFFESIAGDRPVVIVLDDIHWAEPTLLDLIEYLGEWGEAPMLVLCAARRELLEARPAWAGPTSTGFVIGLEPLTPDDVSMLISRLASDPVDPEIQDRIVEHAGGNPLFAEQLLALAAEAADPALDDPPPSVETLLASRLDRLDPRELAVLRRASVVGRRFSREELDDLTPEAEGKRTQRHLVDLAQRALIHPGDDAFRFHHILVRDVAYRGIPKAERAHLHERAARGLDRRDGTDELVGYHFEQAYRYLTQLGRPDDRARELAAAAGKRLGSAGIRAWKRADAPAAANLLTRAVDLLPEADELACELGVALHVRGEVDRAGEVLARAAESSEKRIELRARIELAFLRSVLEPDCAGELLEIASAAIPALEAACDDRALGRAWLSIGYVKGGYYCEYAAFEDAAARAATHYRRAGWSPSTALGYLAVALYYGPKSVEDAVAQCEDLLGKHEGDRASEANVLAWFGGLEAMRGGFDDARALVARAKTMYRDLGLAAAAADICGRVLGAIEMLAGSPEAAERALRQSCESLQQSRQTAVLATRAAELADAIYAQGRYDDAESWTRVARNSAGADDLDAALSWQPVEAKILARQGSIEAAEQLARDTLELVSRTDALNRHGDSLLALAEVLRIADRHDEALEVTRAALPLYELKGNLASANRARALLPDAALAE